MSRTGSGLHGVRDAALTKPVVRGRTNLVGASVGVLSRRPPATRVAGDGRTLHLHREAPAQVEVEGDASV
ncbi:hypothetical protein DN069_26400 [Streptacidiphilus pinicola]|uniref:Uncharacterized protein n=1 Tax=Streptacidiphilus pinicola TaxID=2219663 RepID=A0A2X0IGA6_9ACTN|nr:hypothetical protein DN069_26400 [Streptacidiphilus pinicola]